MKAVLFYGVRLPVQVYKDGRVYDDYGYVFSENFVGSDWELHVRQSDGRYSAYLSLSRLTVGRNDPEPFRLINPRGIQDTKMTPPEREELKDILKALGVAYASPKWFLTVSGDN